MSMASPVPFRLRHCCAWRESIILGDAALLCKPHSRSCSHNDVILLDTLSHGHRAKRMLVALSPENGVSAHILNGKLGNPARSVHIEIPLEQDSAALKSSFMAAVVPAR